MRKMNQPVNNQLKFLGALDGRNHFSNIPLEFVVPKVAKAVFVSDLFEKDYVGGAELTSEAIIEKAPFPVFRVHSSALTIPMLEANVDKHWIICNFTQMDVLALEYLIEHPTLKYSIVEYDYKYCMFRSEVLHLKQTGSPCDCTLRPHSILVERFYSNAEHVFWMSEAQKEAFLNKVPSLHFCDEGHHVVQSSTFRDSDLDFLLSVKNSREQKRAQKKKLPLKVWAVQGSQNWIKGTQETVAMAAKQKMAVKILGNMPYRDFILAMSECDGFLFQPLDLDTCPRVVIEAKILGLELMLNTNVQHQDEDWFKDKSPEEIVEHLKTRGDFFWSNIKV